MKKHYQLPGGYRMCWEAKVLTIELNGAARVLSTSHLNGGYRDDIRYIFNFCEIFDSPDDRCEMRAATNEGHLVSIAEELGLNPEVTTGLSTAAHMKHARPHSEHYRDFSVTAIATAGIDVNGSRVGDPACWHEEGGVPVLEKPGTINIFLLIDANLTEGAMARALVTCSEAKVAALQEVQAPSLYSNGLATGSGTDGTIVVCNSASPIRLTNAGHHSKLGEYIGRVVKDAMKAALVAEDGAEKYTGGSALGRLKRFGVTEERLLELYRANRDRKQADNLASTSFVVEQAEKIIKVPDPDQTKDSKTDPNAIRVNSSNLAPDVGRWQGSELDANLNQAKEEKSDPDSGRIDVGEEAEFLSRLRQLDNDTGFITRVSVFAHLLDLLQWELVGFEEARRIGENIFSSPAEKGHPPAPRQGKQKNPDTAINDLIACLITWLSQNKLKRCQR
ncbi:MAG: adenosylcobinamide amidohydrolase [Bacillota bacterium]